MRKIPTLFRRDPDDMKHVLPEVTPGCEWVLRGEGRATRKYDGTCVMLDPLGNWWARREVRPGKATPPGFDPVDHDPVTGKTVGWEPVQASGFAKWHAEAVENGTDFPVGTYELCGPKVQGNPEGFDDHVLVAHHRADRYQAMDSPLGHDELRHALLALPWEGIVWHHPDGRMAKLKRRDFA